MDKIVDFDLGMKKQSQKWSEQFRFDLYLRKNEVDNVYQILNEVRGKDKFERLLFVKENRGFLDDLAAEIWEKAQEALTEVSFDQESLELVSEYTNTLRDTFNLIRELKSTPLAKES